MNTPALDVHALTPEERIDLIGQLWDSLDPEPLAPSSEVIDELRRRSAALDVSIERGEPLGESWESVKARLLNKVEIR